MATPDHRSEAPASALPDELCGLTYDQASAEQIALVRQHMRARLAAADERWTPEEREQRRAAFLARLDAA